MPTILVVDDDAAICEMLAQALEDEGYGVRMARNGAEALASLRDQVDQPQLILLDLNMPVMSGWDFLAELQHAPALAAIPVVVITAGYQANQRRLAVPPAGYLAKPLDLTTLLDTVARFCGS